MKAVKAKARFKPRCSGPLACAPNHRALSSRILSYRGIAICLTAPLWRLLKNFCFYKTAVNTVVSMSCELHSVWKAWINCSLLHSCPKQSLCCPRTHKSRKPALSQGSRKFSCRQSISQSFHGIVRFKLGNNVYTFLCLVWWEVVGGDNVFGFAEIFLVTWLKTVALWSYL